MLTSALIGLGSFAVIGVIAWWRKAKLAGPARKPLPGEMPADPTAPELPTLGAKKR